ncbi:ATP-binding protein [Streptomyces sp. NPDC048527]|uniref:ATP-binding protein n=1 Tax=Streptomyces sp. NPDC048527 TaxID=3365568 RepID=UPI00371F9467
MYRYRVTRGAAGKPGLRRRMPPSPPRPHREQSGEQPSPGASCAVALVVGELAANAVQHGRVPGRAAAGLVRVKVADAADAKRPLTAAASPSPEGEAGRGLLLVDVVAVRWGPAPRWPVGKTVWAEVSVEAPTGLLC